MLPAVLEMSFGQGMNGTSLPFAQMSFQWAEIVVFVRMEPLAAAAAEVAAAAVVETVVHPVQDILLTAPEGAVDRRSYSGSDIGPGQDNRLLVIAFDQDNRSLVVASARGTQWLAAVIVAYRRHILKAAQRRDLVQKADQKTADRRRVCRGDHCCCLRDKTVNSSTW